MTWSRTEVGPRPEIHLTHTKRVRPWHDPVLPVTGRGIAFPALGAARLRTHRAEPPGVAAQRADSTAQADMRSAVARLVADAWGKHASIGTLEERDF